MRWRDDPATTRPMLASLGEVPLDSSAFAYEPKYDGIRAIISIEPDAQSPRVETRNQADPTRDRKRIRFWSRLGNEKTLQFPELVTALERWARGLERPLLLDGEIVALDARGEPCGFQHLQGRIHGEAALRRAAAACATEASRIAVVAFDILRDGDEDVRDRALPERRARLEALFADRAYPAVRISEQVVGDGRALYERAQRLGWEGLIAKRLDSVYKSGRRVPDWRKVKLVLHQTCVIAGWTEPRGSRPFFGALLLGVYEDGELRSIGHTGAGFTDAELGRVWRRMHAIETIRCPFQVRPRTNEKPHWVEPRLVAEVKFTEWTADAKLRQPTYLGLRDDVNPRTVHREPQQGRVGPVGRVGQVGRVERVGPAGRATRAPAMAANYALRSQAVITQTQIARLLDQIDAIDQEGGSGTLALPGGDRLAVSNLRKIFWPKGKLTKGDLLRHYVRVAPYLLPVLADRPLVLKRFPNGITAKPFYQHRAADNIPPGVRAVSVEAGGDARLHLIGGSLTTLLYTTQLAAISQDPWFSRVGSEDTIDHVAIDLDPPEGIPFARVRDVARWVHDVLETLDVPGFPKTSGAAGLHVYVPMPTKTPYEAGLLFCQIIATMVAKKHPRACTVERSLKARGSRVYVDYLQNVRGKTLASAYSARASDFAGVSTPLTWTELEDGVSPRDFTLRNFSERLTAVGDLWAALRKSRGADLTRLRNYE